MFPVTEILDKEFVARDSSHRELWRCCALDAHWVATQIGRCFRTLIRIVCVSAVSTFAILVPSLGGTLGIMGGFCFIFIGALNGCDVCATDSQSCMQECYSLCYSSWSCLKRSWVVASSGGWLFLQSLQAQWVCWLLWMQSSTRSVEIRCRDCLYIPVQHQSIPQCERTRSRSLEIEVVQKLVVSLLFMINNYLQAYTSIVQHSWLSGVKAQIHHSLIIVFSPTNILKKWIKSDVRVSINQCDVRILYDSSNV